MDSSPAGERPYVVAVFQAGDHALADAELAGDLSLGHLRRFADHGQIPGVDPVRLLGVSVGCGDLGSDFRVG